MGTGEKKATPETLAEKPPEKDQKSSLKPRMRGAFKFKTWEEKERWEKDLARRWAAVGRR